MTRFDFPPPSNMDSFNKDRFERRMSEDNYSLLSRPILLFSKSLKFLAPNLFYKIARSKDLPFVAFKRKCLFVYEVAWNYVQHLRLSFCGVSLRQKRSPNKKLQQFCCSRQELTRTPSEGLLQKERAVRLAHSRTFHAGAGNSDTKTCTACLYKSAGQAANAMP